MSQHQQVKRRTLRQWRAEHEPPLTQFELAATAGVSLSTVVNIEANRQEPGVTTAQRLADALGVSVGDIVWPTREQLVRRRPKDRAVA